MPIERDLHELLFGHDCVIVPRFGGFLTHYRPARLDEQRQLVHPPSKDVSFNRHLTRTDGLLTDHVAKREGIGFNQAGAVIDGEVDAWQSKIARDGRLELPRIGTFYRDGEHNLQFEPDRRVNFLKNAFGLRPVPAVPLAPARAATGAKVIALPVPPRQEVAEVEEARRFPVLWAAAVVAILSTAVTWWVVADKGPAGVQWSGFDLFTPAEPGRYVPRSGAPLVPEPADTNTWKLPTDQYGVQRLAIDAGDGAMMMVDLGPEPIPVTAPDPSHPAVADTTSVVMPEVRSRFHIIGGCFLQKDNADGFVATLQARGFAATIIDQKGGLYRVAYGSYPKRTLAMEALSAVRKEVAPQAWLLIQ